MQDKLPASLQTFESSGTPQLAAMIAFVEWRDAHGAGDAGDALA